LVSIIHDQVRTIKGLKDAVLVFKGMAEICLIIIFEKLKEF
jgi:hypothetical protein